MTFFRPFLFSRKAVRLLVTSCRCTSRNLKVLDNPMTDGEIPPTQRQLGLTKEQQNELLRLVPDQPPDPQLIKVAIIGAPNAGKSTLMNRLMSWKVSAVSSKVHTTRSNTLGVYTQHNTQIIFLDTPGMISPEHQKRHRLDVTMVVDPHIGLIDADIVGVVVDVANYWTCHYIDAEVLQALKLHINKPTILILNKIDKVKTKEALLEITRNLTAGVVDGVQDSLKVSSKKKPECSDIIKELYSDETTDSLPRNAPKTVREFVENQNKKRLQDKQLRITRTLASKEDKSNNCEISIKTENSNITERGSTESGSDIPIYGDEQSDSQDSFSEDNVSAEQSSEELLQSSDLRRKKNWDKYYAKMKYYEDKRERSWSNFKKVFMVSALNGEGICELKNYFMNQGQARPWRYHSSLVTDLDPKKMACQCVWEKLMEHLPMEIPYQIKVEVAHWDFDDCHYLRAVFNLVCPATRHKVHALGKKGDVIKKVAEEAKQELMNTFKCDLTLQLIVK